MSSPRRRTAPMAPGKFMLPVYQEMDRGITAAIGQLQKGRGITITCAKGCHFCCRQQIPTQPLEAAAIVTYVQEKFSKVQIEALRKRTREWFRWLRQEMPLLIQKGMSDETAFYAYGPYCPFLVEGECSIYPVRPAVCRTHYVSSDPRSCRPRETDPEALAEEPKILYEISVAVSPILHRVRNLLEQAGMNLEDSVMLLPQWFAMHMNWKDLWDGGEEGA